MGKPILPPSAARIAQEAGPVIAGKYKDEGLTCYREEIQVGVNTMVREGYIKVQDVGGGRKLYIKVMTKVITRREAEDNE
jgi:hypothetical protein